MLKIPQIEHLSEHGMHYITAITKPQIESLLNTKVLQMELFDQPLAEVSEEKVRYVCGEILNGRLRWKPLTSTN